MRAILILMLMVASVGSVTLAQADCTIDLAASIELLEQAQTAANDDDTEQATALIGEAQQALSVILTSCAFSGEQTTYTLKDDGHTLTFDYPTSWVIEPMDDTTIGLASSQALMDRDVFGSSEPKPLGSGEIMAMIGLMNADSFALGDEATPTAVDLINILMEGSDDAVESISEPEAFAASDFRAARTNVVFNGVDATLVVIELDTRSTPTRDFYFALMVVAGAPGSSEAVAEIAHTIGQSMRYSK